MKNIAGWIVVGWSIFAAILASMALQDFREQFSEHRFYFAYLKNPKALMGSADDLRMKELLEEAARRKFLRDWIREFEAKGHDGGLYVEYIHVPPTFYWSYAAIAITIWLAPILAVLFVRRFISKATNDGN